MCKLEKVKKKILTYLYFKKEFDLQIYLHRNGEEIWLSLFEFPTEVVIFRLKIKNETEMNIFCVKISEKETTLLKNSNNLCRIYDDYQNENFVSCFKTKLDEYLKSTFNCTIPGIGHLIKSKAMENCKSRESAAHVFHLFASFVLNNSYNNTYLGCTLPCKQTSYNYKLYNYHINNWINTSEHFNNSEEYVHFSISFNSLLVEERVENLVYDFGNFLAAAGGNLSLTLGFSCLSIFLGSMQYFKTKITCLKKQF